MTKNVLGIINLMENDSNITELTTNRTIAAIPFAGRYRIIDFVLSNMVNSGIQDIGIFTTHKYKSVQDHVGIGRYWDLDRKIGGLRLFQPGSISSERKRGGEIENFQNNIGFIEYAQHEYVLISRSFMVTSIDYNKVYDHHVKSKADITMICKAVSPKEFDKSFVGRDQVEVGEDGFVKSIGTNVGVIEEKANIALDMYIMKKSLFHDIIVDAYQKGYPDTIKEAILGRLGTNTFDICLHTKEVRCINTVNNYYNASMDLLKTKYFEGLFRGEGGNIYTKVKDEPSTYYGAKSDVSNSLIANGCIIEGVVENCIIFRGVEIKKGAEVRNSILMQDTIIEENSKLNYCIADKNVRVNKNKTLMGDKSLLFTLKKNTVIE